MRISPKLSQHSNNITLNEHLWEKVKYVYDNRAAEHLCTEDSMLLQEVYDMFVSSGANLKGADRDKYRSLSAELSQLSLQFEQNTVKARAGYEMWLPKDDLDGLPESAVEAAALAAKEKGREGEYLFSLQQTVYSNFMRYSSRRDLRKKYYKKFSQFLTPQQIERSYKLERQSLKRLAERQKNRGQKAKPGKGRR